MNAGDKGEIGSTEKYRIFDEQAPRPVVVVLVVGIEVVIMALVVMIVAVIVAGILQRVVFLVVKFFAVVI